MTVRSGETLEASTPAQLSAVPTLHQDGIIAGVIGAAVIALWFLLVDSVQGRPLYTPTVLGTALFRGGAGLGTPEMLPPSMEMVWMFTWVHGLLFVAIGGIASWLLALAERDPDYGFGILLLFVFFQFGFFVAAMVFAASLLQAISAPAVLVGNLLASAAMAAYFWRRHPRLNVRP
jgi:hypothetical protein